MHDLEWLTIYKVSFIIHENQTHFHIYPVIDSRRKKRQGIFLSFIFKPQRLLDRCELIIRHKTGILQYYNIKL